MRVARSFEFAQGHRQRARQTGERHSGAGGNPCRSALPPSRYRRPSRPGCRARKHIVEWMEAKARARSSMGLLVLGTVVSLAVAILSGCGLKTAPRPVGQVLPPVAGFQVRQRPSEALISWIVPSQADGDRFGGLRGYRLLCTACRYSARIARQRSGFASRFPPTRRNWRGKAAGCITRCHSIRLLC